MAAMRWYDPDDAEPMEEALERLITELADRKGAFGMAVPLAQPESRPVVDLEESAGHFRVLAELPAVSPDEVSLLAQPKSLTIEGRWGGAAPHASGRSHLRETRRGGFRRVVELPAPILAEGAAARLEQGLLVVDLPKADGDPGAFRAEVPLLP